MKYLFSRKVIVPFFAGIAALSLCVPAFAYSSVRATATVTITKYSTYYKAKATGKVTSSGSNSGGQVIENFTTMEFNGTFYDSDDDRDTTSPVNVTINSDKEGDSGYWSSTVTGTLLENGVEIDWDEDDDEEYTAGI